MKKKYLFWIIVAIVAIVVGMAVDYVAHNVVRDALVRVYQVVYQFASAIPQPYYWLVLIAVIVASAARSLLGDAGGRPGPLAEPAGGRAAEWREWLERAEQSTDARLFYRWRVARNLARLTSEVAAHQQGISPGEAERQIEDGDLGLPADIRDYFLASIRSRPTRSRSRWSRLPHIQPSGPLDLDPGQVVELIETQMEVPHDNRHP